MFTDSSFLSIAYSCVDGSDGSINTAEQYRWAAKNDSFNAIKGDIRISSDGKLIMCHDPGFTLDENGEIIFPYDDSTARRIRELTEAECFAITHADTHQHVTGFEQYIEICAACGKTAFITVRDEYIDEIVPELFRILDKYDMRSRSVINSFTYETLLAVRRFSPEIRLSWVRELRAVITPEMIDEAMKLGNCLINGFSFRFSRDEDESLLTKNLEGLTYAKEKNVKVFEAIVANPSLTPEIFMKYGVHGAQYRVVPDHG